MIQMCLESHVVESPWIALCIKITNVALCAYVHLFTDCFMINSILSLDHFQINLELSESKRVIGAANNFTNISKRFG